MLVSAQRNSGLQSKSASGFLGLITWQVTNSAEADKRSGGRGRTISVQWGIATGLVGFFRASRGFFRRNCLSLPAEAAGGVTQCPHKPRTVPVVTTTTCTRKVEGFPAFCSFLGFVLPCLWKRAVGCGKQDL